MIQKVQKVHNDSRFEMIQKGSRDHKGSKVQGIKRRFKMNQSIKKFKQFEMIQKGLKGSPIIKKN